MPKRKPPSRLRYEAAHPTITVRVPAEVKHRIQAAARAEGLSVSEWVQAQAAGYAAEAAAAYARGLALGRKLQAVVDAAAYRLSHGSDPGSPWFEWKAAEAARHLTPAERDVLHRIVEELLERPTTPRFLPGAVDQWLAAQGLPPLGFQDDGRSRRP